MLRLYRCFIFVIIMSFCTKASATVSTIVSEGMQAPVINLLDSKLNVFNSNDYLNKKNIVLYFYPKDTTPGCTIEAKQFSNLISEFEKLDTIIIGVSKDSAESHETFIQSNDLKMTLLSDSDLALAKQYGVYKKGLLSDVNRDTFFIDKNGIIRKIWRNVFAIGHAADVLKTITTVLTNANA